MSKSGDMEPVILEALERFAYNGAAHGPNWLTRSFEDGSGGIRTRSMPRSERGWSANCLPSRAVPLGFQGTGEPRGVSPRIQQLSGIPIQDPTAYACRLASYFPSRARAAGWDADG